MSKLRVSPFPNNPKQNLASHPSCPTGTAFKNYAALCFSLPRRVELARKWVQVKFHDIRSSELWVPRRPRGYSRCDTSALRFEPVRGALWATQHSVRFVVVLETLLHWIPVEMPFELHGDVIQQAGGAGAVRDLGGRR